MRLFDGLYQERQQVPVRNRLVSRVLVHVHGLREHRFHLLRDDPRMAQRVRSVSVGPVVRVPAHRFQLFQRIRNRNDVRFYPFIGQRHDVSGHPYGSRGRRRGDRDVKWVGGYGCPDAYVRGAIAAREHKVLEHRIAGAVCDVAPQESWVGCRVRRVGGVRGRARRVGSEVGGVRGRVRRVGSEVGGVQRRVRRVGSKVGHIRCGVCHVASEVGGVRGRVRHVRSEVGGVRGRVRHVRSEVGRVRGRIRHVGSEVGGIGGRVRHVQSEVGGV